MSKENSVVAAAPKKVTNIYDKKLSKVLIFNLSQDAQPVGDILDTKVKVVGLHHKTVSTDKGELTLTIIFVDEDGEVKTYFSSAASFLNSMEEVGSIFGTDIEKGGLELTVSQIETRGGNTVYKVSL